MANGTDNVQTLRAQLQSAIAERDQFRQIMDGLLDERNAALVDRQKLQTMVGYFAGDSVDVAAELGHVSGDLRVGDDGAITGEAAYRPPSDWVSPHAAAAGGQSAAGSQQAQATGQRAAGAGQAGAVSPLDKYIEGQKQTLESGALGPGRDGFTGQRP